MSKLNHCLTNLKKSEEYNDFKKDDIVTISGEKETRYKFNGVVLNERTGSMWAELFGGRKGRGPQLRGRSAGYRFVDPKRLRKVKK